MNISASVGTEQINCLLSTVYLLPFSNILSLKPARRVALFFSRNYRFCNLTGVFSASRKMQNMLYNILGF